MPPVQAVTQSPPLSREDESLDCYQDEWLERFDQAEGRDLLLQEEEKIAFDALVTAAEDVERPRSALRYLDVGTCTGRYLAWALDRGIGAVHGLDRSQHAVAFSRRKLGARVRIVQADILSGLPELVSCGSPLSDGSHELVDGGGETLSLWNMDLVSIMFGTLNHFSEAEQRVVLRNIQRCLRDSGSLVISSWQPGKCDFSLYDARDRDLLASRGMSIAELRALGAVCDLELVDWAYTSSKLVALLRRAVPSGQHRLVERERSAI